MAIHVYFVGQPSAMVPMIAKDPDLWLAWVGADSANMNYVDMQAGERNQDRCPRRVRGHHLHPRRKRLDRGSDQWTASGV